MSLPRVDSVAAALTKKTKYELSHSELSTAQIVVQLKRAVVAPSDSQMHDFTGRIDPRGAEAKAGLVFFGYC